MQKEISLLIATSMLVNSCRPIVAKAMEVPNGTGDPKISTEIPPITFTPEPTQIPTTFPTPFLLGIIDQEIEAENKTLLANSCTLPFEGADIDLGLQFLSVLENEGNGKIHRHLGLDFKGSYEGQDVVNMCDGIVVFSGAVKQGEGRNLGNIVVIKYSYYENDILVNIYMRYAHMENLTNLNPGDVILKGQKIGEIGHSGGWPANQNHLHIDALKEDAFNAIVVERSNGDLKNEIGFYAPAELWSKGMISSKFVDVKKWLLERFSEN